MLINDSWGFIAKKGEEKHTFDCKIRVFLSIITKKKKNLQSATYKGANENNKNKNAAFRTSCGLIRLLFEGYIS